MLIGHSQNITFHFNLVLLIEQFLLLLLLWFVVVVVIVAAAAAVVVVAVAFIGGISCLILIKTIQSLKTFRLNSEKTQDSLSTLTADTECKQKRIIVLQNAKFTQTSDSFC